MNNRLQSILVILAAAIYMLLIWKITKMGPSGKNPEIEILELPERKYSTDTFESIRGKKILFVGDSHSANKSSGWQKILCQKTGAIEKNIAVKGKITKWMLQRLKESIDTTFEYCFIWGGGNDMSNNVSSEKVIENLKSMIQICRSHGVKPVILTGINVRECVKEGNFPNYIKKCEELQLEIQKSITDEKVIKNHFVSRTDGDCADIICHMNQKGHKKMAKGILSEMKFKIDQ